MLQEHLYRGTSSSPITRFRGTMTCILSSMMVMRAQRPPGREAPKLAGASLPSYIRYCRYPVCNRCLMSQSVPGVWVYCMMFWVGANGKRGLCLVRFCSLDTKKKRAHRTVCSVFAPFADENRLLYFPFAAAGGTNPDEGG